MEILENASVRDRDYLLDEDGLIFKVIGDVHPATHYLGYVKYFPDKKGDRRLFGETYRLNTVVSKSFGILADRPDYYVYSETLGCVITGVPRAKVVQHYSCRQALGDIYTKPEMVDKVEVGQDLLKIIDNIYVRGHQNLFGVTGSFLIGCFNDKSDVDLVCYGNPGYVAAQELFADRSIIVPYENNLLTQLYQRRAKYLVGNDFNSLMKQEQRKLQGLTANRVSHINCEPLRSDHDLLARNFSSLKQIGEISVLAEVGDHSQGLLTPSRYEIAVRNVLSATVDEPDSISKRIRYMFSYLGAYTGAFRSGDLVHLTGKLVHVQNENNSDLGIELTPWSTSGSHSASLIA